MFFNRYQLKLETQFRILGRINNWNPISACIIPIRYPSLISFKLLCSYPVASWDFKFLFCTICWYLQKFKSSLISSFYTFVDILLLPAAILHLIIDNDEMIYLLSQVQVKGCAVSSFPTSLVQILVLDWLCFTMDIKGDLSFS